MHARLRAGGRGVAGGGGGGGRVVRGGKKKQLPVASSK